MCEAASQPVLNSEIITARKTIRKKIWQLDASFHCCIIGTCLTLDELRSMAKKYFPVDNNTCDYELHCTFVCFVQYSNKIAHYCQKYLDKKYRSLIRKYASLKSDSEIQSLWNKAYASGDVAGIYWTLTTHPNTSEQFRHKIYGDVHMLSHLSGASARTDIKLLGKLRCEKVIVEEKLKEQGEVLSKRLLKKQAELNKLKDKVILCDQGTQEIKNLKNRVHELEESDQQNLNNTIENLSDHLYNATYQLSSVKRKNSELEDKLQNEQKRNRLLEAELDEGLKERNAAEACLQELLSQSCDQACGVTEVGGCPIKNLEGRKILYVGGRVNQCPYFKLLVEQSNGLFFYHDGGREDGRCRLDGILAQADAVVCPTTCISHDAFKCVKSHCAKQEKQLIMIAHASLASFTKGLSEVLV